MPGNELETLMNTMFSGYKYRKSYDLLYSKSEHYEFGGVLRNTQAFLKDCPIDVSYPDNIFMDLINLEDDFNELKKEALIMIILKIMII